MKETVVNVSELHPQYITDVNGEKISVVLSMHTFETLLEDMEDLAAIAERRHDDVTSHDAFMLELKQDGLI